MRAHQAENIVLVEKIYGGILGAELRSWLNKQDITSINIGAIRRACFVPWGSNWNALVRDETSAREKSTKEKYCRHGVSFSNWCAKCESAMHATPAQHSPRKA